MGALLVSLHTAAEERLTSRDTALADWAHLMTGDLLRYKYTTTATTNTTSTCSLASSSSPRLISAAHAADRQIEVAALAENLLRDAACRCVACS
jgi:hypothetical protein